MENGFEMVEYEEPLPDPGDHAEEEAVFDPPAHTLPRTEEPLPDPSDHTEEEAVFGPPAHTLPRTEEPLPDPGDHAEEETVFGPPAYTLQRTGEPLPDPTLPRTVSLTEDQFRRAVAAYQVMTARMQLEKCLMSVLRFNKTDAPDFATQDFLYTLGVLKDKLAALHTCRREQMTLVTVSKPLMNEVSMLVAYAEYMLMGLMTPPPCRTYQGSNRCFVAGALSCIAWFSLNVYFDDDCCSLRRFVLTASVAGVIGSSFAHGNTVHSEKRERISNAGLLTTIKQDFETVSATLANILTN